VHKFQKTNAELLIMDSTTTYKLAVLIDADNAQPYITENLLA